MRDGRRISDLLKQNTEISNRIIAAYEITGNACIERDEHTAFLLLAIALESAVLGKETREELTYQLATRVAHLISQTLTGRRAIVRKIKRLYGIRSKVVHTGRIEISASEVREMRLVCLTTLHSITVIAEAESIKSNQDLENWFQTRLLQSTDLVIEVSRANARAVILIPLSRL